MTSWATYRLGGRLVLSNIEFVELARCSGAGPQIRCELQPSLETHAEPDEWFHGWRLEGSGAWWMRAAVVDGEYLLRFPGLLDCRVSRNGGFVRCQPIAGTPLETVRHLLLDQILPLAIGLGGHLVLHASAVAVAGRVLAFIGPSGSGKSTLAAWLGGHGGTVLTDDCLVLEEGAEGWWALPYYEGVRLWPDDVDLLLPGRAAVGDVAHYSRKRRATGPRGAGRVPAAQQLAGLLFLSTNHERPGSPAVVVGALAPRAAMMALVRASFLLEIRSPPVLARHLEAIGRLAGAVPCLALRYPRLHSVLAEVQEALTVHFAAASVSRRERAAPPARAR